MFHARFLLILSRVQWIQCAVVRLANSFDLTTLFLVSKREYVCVTTSEIIAVNSNSRSNPGFSFITNKLTFSNCLNINKHFYHVKILSLIRPIWCR